MTPTAYNYHCTANFYLHGKQSTMQMTIITFYAPVALSIFADELKDLGIVDITLMHTTQGEEDYQ